MKSILRAIKDKSGSSAVRLAVNHYLERYGHMKKILIDSERRTITLELALKGESEPILVVVEEYELVSEGGAFFLVPNRVTTSREWLTVLAQSLVAGRRLPLPHKLPEQVLRLLL